MAWIPLEPTMQAAFAPGAVGHGLPITVENASSVRAVWSLPWPGGRHSGDYSAISWHPTAGLFALAYPAQLWTPDAQLRLILREQRGGWWSHTGRWWWTVSAEKVTPRVVTLYDLERQRVTTLARSPQTALYWHPVAPMAAVWDTGTHDLTFQDLETGSSLVPPAVPFQQSWSAWSSDGCWFMAMGPVTQGSQRFVRACWTAAGDLHSVAEIPPAIPWVSVWSPASAVCLTLHGNQVRWWSPVAGDIGSYDLTPQAVDAAYFTDRVVWSPDGQYIAVVQTDHVSILTAAGTLISRCGSQLALPADVLNMAWHPTLPMLAVGSRESCLSLWTVEGELLHSIPTWHRLSSVAAPYTLGWSPDGRYLVAQLRNFTTTIYGIPSNDPP